MGCCRGGLRPSEVVRQTIPDPAEQAPLVARSVTPPPPPTSHSVRSCEHVPADSEKTSRILSSCGGSNHVQTAETRPTGCTGCCIIPRPAAGTGKSRRVTSGSPIPGQSNNRARRSAQNPPRMRNPTSPSTVVFSPLFRAIAAMAIWPMPMP